VRGDSLRDLYAKGLAVLGLGLLAGAGALVDYWPAAVEMPRVANDDALAKPALARVLRADHTNLNVSTLTPASGAAVRAASPGVRAAVPTATRVAAASSAARPIFDVPVRAFGLSLQGGLMVDAVAIAMPIGLEPISTVASVGTEVPLSLPTLMTHAADVEELTATASPVSHDEDGFLTGAMKKTGTSIIRTGVKTGASIRDAMRAIGGAVRRAFPG
jgi:hypothetical protein